MAAAGALARRLLGAPSADRFVFEMIPAEQGRDVFELASGADGAPVIRGSDAGALATGLHWYLKHCCHRHVSWYGARLDLPDPLPRVDPPIRRVAWAAHRYFLNYCCFGYSLPWCDWAQWERLIDWMALNGVNRPLAVTGQEAVWQAVCRHLGLTDAQTARFFAGPPYLPFQWMGCLDAHGGPLPADWIPRHEELGRKILARQRELGMTPVLQGFTGHVPPALAERFPEAKLHRIRWIEWETNLLDPLDPLFARVARLFLDEQTRRFGTDHLYAADTFIEMKPPSGDLSYLAALARAIHGGMTASDPAAIWVLQGWAFMNQRAFWTQPRIASFLNATPEDRMLVLDLYCETRPMWDRTDAFCGKPWLWCNVQSFGRTVALGAALDRNNRGLFDARRHPGRGRLVGLGFVNEGLCYNPVAYDLLFENAWRDAPVDLAAWIADYAHHRYGEPDARARRAWATLLDTVLNTPSRDASRITATPTLRRTRRFAAGHDTLRVADAWRDLLGAADRLGAIDTLRFDLVNVARQALADHADVLHADVADAWRAKDLARFESAAGRFIELIVDLDTLLATRREFLLGPWIEDAKRWGAAPAEQARCEWNARRVLTLWGDTAHLDGYARKQWAGLLSNYYAPRWKLTLDRAADALRAGRTLDEDALGDELVQWTIRWTETRASHPTEPRGDSAAIARALWAKHGGSFTASRYAALTRPTPAAADAISLTTGKPATCSSALPGHPARLANDGVRADTDLYWAVDVGTDPDPWWQVDLERPATVGRVVLVCYHGDTRHYGFTVEVSSDGHTWEIVADRRTNRAPSTEEGYTCTFAPRPVRCIRVRQTHNSANTGRHLVEVMAYER